jgi:sulfur carrier protein ThiS
VNVHLCLHATLRTKRRKYSNTDSIETNASSVGELLAQLNISEHEAAIVFVNDKRAGVQTSIRDGDKIKLFPLLGGG